VKPANAAPAPAKPVQPQPAAPAKAKARHFGLFFSFLLLVLAPFVASSYYIWRVAEGQYTSTVGFSVRSEEVQSVNEIFSGITSLGSASSSDTDILYEFIQSQELVRLLDDQLDLRMIYSRPVYDPIFAFDTDGKIEDLVDYWQRMVKIFYDGGTGLIELRVHAFTPDDAQTISRAVFAASSDMINNVSAIGRDNATRYAGEELEKSVEQLKIARQELTEFRSRNQVVDPSADIQGQTGLINSLESQLASSIIELNVARQSSSLENNPIVDRAQRRIEVIQRLIDEERQKLGGGASGSEDLSKLVGEYEGLIVEREYAESAYIQALGTFNSAQAEARRQSRYLAAYTQPTLAESAQYPQRELLTLLMAVFLMLSWSIGALVFYSVRDRR